MTIVLDANILIRAVLGRRVYDVLKRYPHTVFAIPARMVDEARLELPAIIKNRGGDPEIDSAVLEDIVDGLHVIEPDIYAHFEADAMARIGKRDATDWPVVAVALYLGSPIWTEDADFFGCGIPTWTTDRVELFLRSGATEQ